MMRTGVLFDAHRGIAGNLFFGSTKCFSVLICRRLMVAMGKMMNGENNPEGYGHRTAQY